MKRVIDWIRTREGGFWGKVAAAGVFLFALIALLRSYSRERVWGASVAKAAKVQARYEEKRAALDEKGVEDREEIEKVYQAKVEAVEVERDTLKVLVDEDRAAFKARLSGALKKWRG